MKDLHYLKEFIRYTSLNILAMMAISFYILVDTYFISKGVGANGLAALNLAIPVFNLINGCGQMLGMGGAIRYSIYKGQKQSDNQKSVFTNTVYIGACLSLVFFITGIFASESLANLLGANADTFMMTCTYLKVLLLFSPAFIMSSIVNAFVRNDGNPRLAMAGTIGGSLANILFDYIFIFPMQMGIFGAVLATGFAPVINMIIQSRHFLQKRNGFGLTWIKPGLTITKATIPLGIPSLITELSSGIVIIVFNFIILKLKGNVGVAAYGVIANLSLVVSAIFSGIAQGMQPLASRTHGRGDSTNTRRILRYALTTTLLLSAAIYSIVFIFSNPITTIFNSEHHVQLQKIAASGLKLYFTCTPFMGFNIVMAVYFASTEKAVPAQLISLLRGLFIIVPMALLLSIIWGINGVWLALPATELAVALLVVTFITSTK